MRKDRQVNADGFIVEMLGDTGKWRVVSESMDEAKACLGAILIYQQSKWPIRVRRINSTEPVFQV